MCSVRSGVPSSGTSGCQSPTWMSIWTRTNWSTVPSSPKSTFSTIWLALGTNTTPG
jgi:hypothetical protein